MWQNLVVQPLASALTFVAEQFMALGVPYAWGFSVIALTLVIKVITFPLSVRQTRSTKAMQELQPQLQALQKKYAGDREKLAQEQTKLYQQAGVNPIGGCLPSLIQLPVWIGLYQALLQLANSGLLAGGFLWIKDLSFPNPQVGTQWLWPGGSAWQGWGHMIAYLSLPVLVVVTQLVTQKLMSPQSTDKSQSAMNSAMMFMPFMFGFFALTFPSGLALYWVTNNIVTMIQQYLLTGRPTASSTSGDSSSPARTSSSSLEKVEETAETEGAPSSGKRVPRQTPNKRARNNGRRRKRN